MYEYNENDILITELHNNYLTILIRLIQKIVRQLVSQIVLYTQKNSKINIYISEDLLSLIHYLPNMLNYKTTIN